MVKESGVSARGLGFDPWAGKTPGEGTATRPSVLPGNPWAGKAWWATVHEVTESGATGLKSRHSDRVSLHCGWFKKPVPGCGRLAQASSSPPLPSAHTWQEERPRGNSQGTRLDPSGSAEVRARWPGAAWSWGGGAGAFKSLRITPAGSRLTECLRFAFWLI